MKKRMPLLKGWKLYLVTILLAYPLLFGLLWTQQTLKRKVSTALGIIPTWMSPLRRLPSSLGSSLPALLSQSCTLTPENGNVKELLLDGVSWQTKDDVYNAFFRAVGVPDWRGRTSMKDW